MQSNVIVAVRARNLREGGGVRAETRGGDLFTPLYQSPFYLNVKFMFEGPRISNPPSPVLNPV